MKHSDGREAAPRARPTADEAPDPGTGRTVMLIRHAEKPLHGERGVTRKGKPNRRSLTVRGWQRAGALIQLFRPSVGSRRPGVLPVPSAIFASRVEAGERSKRPSHTVRPLADLLRLRVDRRFDLDGGSALAERLGRLGGATLVCWHHEALPTLAATIAPDVSIPTTWPDDRFDVLWMLRQAADGGAWTFEQLPQLLLPGDEETVIATGGA